MKKIDNILKRKIVAGVAEHTMLRTFEKALKMSMFNNSVNGSLNLLNQIIFYAKNPNLLRNVPNNFKDPSSPLFLKAGPYASKSTISFGSPF